MPVRFALVLSREPVTAYCVRYAVTGRQELAALLGHGARSPDLYSTDADHNPAVPEPVPEMANVPPVPDAEPDPVSELVAEPLADPEELEPCTWTPSEVPLDTEDCFVAPPEL